MRRLLFVLPLVACSSSAPSAGPADADVTETQEIEDPGPPAPASWDRMVTAPTDEEASKKRESCGYAAGALPKETLGASRPLGAQIPIDTIVIVMQENRSFDHYFSQLRAHGHPDADVTPDGFTNPDIDGTKVAPFRDTQLCFLDTAHSWNAAHTEWADGTMTGFIVANEEKGPVPPHGTPDLLRGTRAMGFYGPEDIPFMYWAADQFAIGDHYHCSVLTSTWTNRMYLYAANSFGRTSNKPPDVGAALTVFDELQMRRVPWKIYATSTPPEAMFVGSFLKYKDFHLSTIDRFYQDAHDGTLPHVVFLDASNGDGSGFDPSQDDEHPPAVMQVGQAFLARVTKAMMASPQWGRSALFITYDEHGGLFDHVPPPSACPPDSTPPQLTATDAPGGYDRLGVRVPFVTISPWAKKGFIGHAIYDHTSITRFVEARFDLPAMSARDANADVPYEMFDFTKMRSDLPAVPDVKVDAAALERCVKTLK
ncbi:MAG: phospholipase C [Polyangiales bacterium]